VEEWEQPEITSGLFHHSIIPFFHHSTHFKK